MAERNAREVGDEPLQNDTVVVAVVHDHLQGQLLRGACFGIGIFRGRRCLRAGPVQDEGEGKVGLEGRHDVSW